ncbi:hypothetical protein MJO29_016047 [Puccinia striiformis f. sp. tritici]|nr:hypothetical protein MJO29_016047 [Puccinia striiformis f. sp. tritici]
MTCQRDKSNWGMSQTTGIKPRPPPEKPGTRLTPDHYSIDSLFPRWITNLQRGEVKGYHNPIPISTFFCCLLAIVVQVRAGSPPPPASVPVPAPPTPLSPYGFPCPPKAFGVCAYAIPIPPPTVIHRNIYPTVYRKLSWCLWSFCSVDMFNIHLLATMIYFSQC